MQKWNLETRDVFFKVRHFSSERPFPISHITIISIDEESCEKLQARWPWSRRTIATLVDRLNQAGARVIGLNLSFTGLEDGVDASTQELVRAIHGHGKVVVGATFDRESRLVKPNPLIAQAVAGYGYLEKIIDPDFKIRRSYLIRLYAGSRVRFESSFPLEVLTQTWQVPDRQARFNSRSGLVTVGSPPIGIFVGPDGSYTINYMAEDEDFIQIPAWKIIQGKVPWNLLKGKAVFVGPTSSLFADTYATPLGMMSGVGVHANEYLAFISGRQLRFVPERLTYFLSWLLSLVVLIPFLRRRFWLGIFMVSAALFSVFLGVEMLLVKDLVMEPFMLLLGIFPATFTGILTYSLKLLLENKGLETTVAHDNMTGLYTYAYLRRRLDGEWDRCRKMKLPVAVVMTDLDHFKQINDTLGHETGNDVIRRAAAVIRQSVRGDDIVSRYGGDEFVILLWRTNLKEAHAFRERLRKLYHAMAQELEPPLRNSSISIGVAVFDPNLDFQAPPTTQKLVEDADQDLFLDKKSRRA